MDLEKLRVAIAKLWIKDQVLLVEELGKLMTKESTPDKVEASRRHILDNKQGC